MTLVQWSCEHCGKTVGALPSATVHHWCKKQNNRYLRMTRVGDVHQPPKRTTKQKAKT